MNATRTPSTENSNRYYLNIFLCMTFLRHFLINCHITICWMDSFPHSMSEDTAVWTDGVILWRWLDSTTDSMDMKLGKLWEMLRDREAWCATVHGVTKNGTRLGDWTRGVHSCHLVRGGAEILPSSVCLAGLFSHQLHFFCHRWRLLLLCLGYGLLFLQREED